jgi:regulator of sigma E protease
MGIIVGIMALSFMIAIHELGHLLMAKVAKVRVRIFSIGIGPRLFAMRYRETVYRLATIPVGGYIVLHDEPKTDLVGGEWAAPSIPAGTRALISIAGPLANVLLAAFLVAGLVPFVDPPYRSQLGLSHDTWSPAMQQKPRAAEQQRRGGMRRGDSRPKTVVLAEIAQVTRGSAAEATGLQRGDRIIGIHLDPAEGWEAIASHTHRSPRKVTLTVKRDGRHLMLDLIPPPTKEADWSDILASVAANDGPDDVLTALTEGTREFAHLIRLTLSFIGELIRGEIPHPTSVVSGPLSFIWMVSEEVAEGGDDFLYVTAYCSIAMAIINMLPIPLLDGGQCLFAVLEVVRRRPCTQRTQAITSYVGLGVVGALIVLATFNDLVWLVGGQ